VTSRLRSLGNALGLIIFFLIAATASVRAQATSTTSPAPHALEAADIEAFLDGLVPLQIETNDIAGATIVIVKDGEVLFAKGYGFSDMKTRAPVTPDTMFRIGSVTKLFTWTAVMQLVEQGDLDLDADINTYLDFKIPATFGKPITLRNLMTHRPGFEDTIKNLGAQNSGIPDLGKYVRNNVPAQIYPPGTMPSYSNYGTALAGYIVERVSGKPFETYVEDHIYKPLGMTHSSLRQPLPKELQPLMSKGYNLASGDEVAFEIVGGYPAGSQSSSALDMAKFMLAHLGRGATGQAHILKPETADLMHNTVTTLDPQANGIALGFYEESRNGMRIIGHGGDTVAFHSDLHLISGQNLGFFVSYNSTGRGDTAPRSALWRKFVDRYFPFTPPPAPKDVKTSAAEVAGTYVTSRRNETSIIRAATDLSQFTVTALDDGNIEIDRFIGVNGKPRRFEPIAPRTFRGVNNQDTIVFKPDANGRMQMIPWSSGVIIFQRTEGAQTPAVLLGVLGGASAILALNLLFWPVAAFVRWRYGVSLGWSGVDHLLRLATLSASAALLACIFGIFTILGLNANNPWVLDDTLDPQLRLFQYAGIAGAGGSLIAVYYALRSWRNPLRGFLGRLKETAVAASCLALVWFAWMMSLFDLSLRY
jgi:CubicO group peptidase (beta-lactamase class C family)